MFCENKMLREVIVSVKFICMSWIIRKSKFGNFDMWICVPLLSCRPFQNRYHNVHLHTNLSSSSIFYGIFCEIVAPPYGEWHNESSQVRVAGRKPRANLLERNKEMDSIRLPFGLLFITPVDKKPRPSHQSSLSMLNFVSSMRRVWGSLPRALVCLL